MIGIKKVAWDVTIHIQTPSAGQLFKIFQIAFSQQGAGIIANLSIRLARFFGKLGKSRFHIANGLTNCLKRKLVESVARDSLAQILACIPSLLRQFVRCIDTKLSNLVMPILRNWNR
ncbi:hypothetical protein HBO04_10415 [Pseudomonas proteolytica]|uniref:hypothetical protein n=1 Tax=Pseudomonas proteolytica TaxID=219574 RepID=UPI001475EDEA|nr:hypothetical protein [Pseudomonas proteolytica]NMZ00532.1 hypothetical protein [Pseudomonas proteolytica]